MSGLLITIKAAEDKGDDVAEALVKMSKPGDADGAVQAWYVMRQDQDTFTIFCTFDNDDDRDSQLKGELADALNDKTESLLASLPHYRPLQTLSTK